MTPIVSPASVLTGTQTMLSVRYPVRSSTLGLKRSSA